MFNRTAWITATAALSLFSAVALTSPAMAQYKFETPNGHQTVAPSQMPQTVMPWQQKNQGNPLHVGNLQFPMGINPKVTQGPMYHVPIVERVVLGLFLMLQLVIASIVAFALTRQKNEDIARHHGHMIDADYHEPHTQRTAEL